MSQDWPSPPQRPDRPPLPRVEDLPVVSEGYDSARVEEAFDAFYRHLAQLDSTLKTLESVEVFSRQAADLRADLRSIRAAGWSPYPRGYPVAPTPSLGFDLPPAVPRIALEVVFLIVVAVIVAVANFNALAIVFVMLIAFAITALVEWIASREHRPVAPVPAKAGEPVVLKTGKGRVGAGRGTAGAARWPNPGLSPQRSRFRERRSTSGSCRRQSPRTSATSTRGSAASTSRSTTRSRTSRLLQPLRTKRRSGRRSARAEDRAARAL